MQNVYFVTMKKQLRTKLFSTVTGATHPNYVKKVIGSLNRRLTGELYTQSNRVLNEGNSENNFTLTSTENHRTVFNIGAEHLRTSGQYTINGSVTTLRGDTSAKSSAKTVNDKILEIERFQPKYYELLPKKCFTRIFETPKVQQVDYKIIHSSTLQRLSKELNPDLIESCNDVESNISCEPETLPLSDSRKTKFSSPWVDQDVLSEQDTFLKLKKQRDAECVKMVQASDVLLRIRKNVKSDWCDELLAEKIILQTDEKCKLLVNKIRDLGYSEVERVKPDHRATITLSNFEFLYEPREPNENKYSDFFIITVSHKTELLVSKIIAPRDNKISVDEKFTFTNVNSDFHVTVKVFTIQMKTSIKNHCCFLGKKTTFYPVSKIYYENVNTSEMMESTVLKPTFSCLGEFSINKFDISSSNFILSKRPCDSTLNPNVSLCLVTDNLKINSTTSGFLTLGVRNRQNEVLYWERKWCVLRGFRMSIYNYPSEEDFGKESVSIDLQHCTTLLMNITDLSRKRAFLLKVGKPAQGEDHEDIDFASEKYFFAADTSSDYKLWTNELHSILNCLRDWQTLVFTDFDY